MVIYQPVSKLPVPIKAYRSVKRLLCIATLVVLVSWLEKENLFSGNTVNQSGKLWCSRFLHDLSPWKKVEKKYIYFFSTFFHGDRSWRNREHHSFPLWLTVFPEKRFSFSNQETSTTKVAIHSNLFTDLYALIGTGSFETGWYITIMKLPFIFCIWIGFILASLGGLRSFLRQLALYRLDWNWKKNIYILRLKIT